MRNAEKHTCLLSPMVVQSTYCLLKNHSTVGQKQSELKSSTNWPAEVTEWHGGPTCLVKDQVCAWQIKLLCCRAVKPFRANRSSVTNKTLYRNQGTELCVCFSSENMRTWQSNSEYKLWKPEGNKFRKMAREKMELHHSVKILHSCKEV